MPSTKQVKYIPEGVPIVLIGFMGSGKSMLGQKLARALGRRFLDLDQAIVRRSGTTIGRLFEEEGEKAFREIEHEELKNALQQSSVIAAGGGVATVPKNRALLRKRKAFVIWLHPSWGALWSRLKKTSRKVRPLLWDQEKNRAKSEAVVRKLYRARLAAYRQIADLRVSVPSRESASTSLKKLKSLITE